MRLNTEQRKQLAEKGIWIREVCDGCHNLILLPWSYTVRDRLEVYCSRACRDGLERANRYGRTRKIGRPKKYEDNSSKQREYRRRQGALRNAIPSH